MLRRCFEIILNRPMMKTLESIYIYLYTDNINIQFFNVYVCVRNRTAHRWRYRKTEYKHTVIFRIYWEGSCVFFDIHLFHATFLLAFIIFKNWKKNVDSFQARPTYMHNFKLPVLTHSEKLLWRRFSINNGGIFGLLSQILINRWSISKYSQHDLHAESHPSLWTGSFFLIHHVLQNNMKFNS